MNSNTKPLNGTELVTFTRFIEAQVDSMKPINWTSIDWTTPSKFKKHTINWETMNYTNTNYGYQQYKQNMNSIRQELINYQ